MQFLTVVNTFSMLFQEKYFLSFVIPPFHLSGITTLIINGLCRVELWVEYGWNYVKFHPYSTHNSTSHNILTIKHITSPRWKSGICFAEKKSQRKTGEKLWTDVKSMSKQSKSPPQPLPGGAFFSWVLSAWGSSSQYLTYLLPRGTGGGLLLGFCKSIVIRR